MSTKPENHAWERSSFCSDSACVEVALDGEGVLLRNSERPDDVVRFTRREWEAFLLAIEEGDFR